MSGEVKRSFKFLGDGNVSLLWTKTYETVIFILRLMLWYFPAPLPRNPVAAPKSCQALLESSNNNAQKNQNLLKPRCLTVAFSFHLLTYLCSIYQALVTEERFFSLRSHSIFTASFATTAANRSKRKRVNKSRSRPSLALPPTIICSFLFSF